MKAYSREIPVKMLRENVLNDVSFEDYELNK
jgi:hypothetical protein